MRIKDLMSKVVVSVNDGRELGLVDDMEIDACSGKIFCIYMSECCFAKKGQKISIPWSDICKIGSDVILVSIKNCFKKA